MWMRLVCRSMRVETLAIATTVDREVALNYSKLPFCSLEVFDKPLSSSESSSIQLNRAQQTSCESQ